MIVAVIDGVPLAVKALNHALLVPVDVGERLQLAIVVHPLGEIDQMDRDALVDRDLVVQGARLVQLGDLVGVPALVLFQDHAGEIHRVLHAQAAMAERTARRIEHVFVRRVVHVDGVLAREREFHMPKHVFRP